MNFIRFTRLLAGLFAPALLVAGFYSCTQVPASNISASLYIPPTASEAPVSKQTAEQAMLEDYDRFFAESMASTQTPGAAVVIVKDNKIIFQRAYGVKEAGKQDSVNAYTVFRVGSLSKGFAGVLAGILVQEGSIAWDEPVQRRFPEFTLRDRAQASRMQVKHLLSHTTGLPHHAYTHLIERGYDLRRIIQNHFPLTPLYGKEGERFNYQNVAFSAIEEVMKGATQKTYSELLAEKIFLPGNMYTASSDFATIKQRANKALPHPHKKGNVWQAEPINTRYYNTVAAGGVNASIVDMGEWLKILLGQRPDIVADSTLNRVFTPVIKTDNGRPVFPHWIGPDNAWYAMGWRVLQHGDDTIVYHGGYVNGFRGEIALNRRDGIAICVLFNASSELGQTCIPAFFDRWDGLRAGQLGWSS